MGRTRREREQGKKKKEKKIKEKAAYFAAGISTPPRVRHFSYREGGRCAGAFPVSNVTLPSRSSITISWTIRRQAIARRLRDESNKTVYPPASA